MNTPRTAPTRVLVDGRVMQDRYHGIGRVVFELLLELAKQDVRLIVLHSPEAGRLPVPELLSQPTVEAIPSAVPVASLRSQWELLRTMRAVRADVVYIPYHLATPILPARAPVVTVIQDCIFERQAAANGRSAFSMAYRMMTRLVINSSAMLLASTQATRQDLQRFYGASLGDEAIVPYGVGSQFFAVPARAAKRPDGLPERYILHVGARRPHKNQKILVAALAELLGSYPDLGLVLVGQRDARVPDEAGELIAKLGLSSRVWEYTQADDEMLLDLYANATVFAFPSLVEGFGLPVLEAMAAGLPVIASDAEAVQEAAGHGALIVPAECKDDWVKALDYVLGTPGVAAELRSRGLTVAAKRTWARSAELTMDALVSAARSPKRGARAQISSSSLSGGA